MLDEAADVVEPGVGDLGRVEHGDHLDRRRRCEGAFDDLDELVAMSDTVGVGREPGVVRQRRVAEHGLAEPRPLTLVLDPELDASIRGTERAVRGDRGVCRAGALRRLAGEHGEVHRVAHPLGQSVEQRDLDRHPGARALPMEQGGEDR